MTKIISYIPQDDKGRFTPSISFIKEFLFILSWFFLLFMALQGLKWHFNLTCSAGGHFTTKEQCNELAQNKMDSQELARQQVLANNQDLYER